jgi:hypothetical protein
VLETLSPKTPATNLASLFHIRHQACAHAAQAKSPACLFVLTKIDEILAWEREVEHQRDWRLENLKSFDEFLEIRFPEFDWRDHI